MIMIHGIRVWRNVMTNRDWDFAFGNLGDPLVDIEEWMIPPFRREDECEQNSDQILNANDSVMPL